MVDGFQNGDPAKPGSVMASVKHFALYGAVEGGRDYNTVDMAAAHASGLFAAL